MVHTVIIGGTHGIGRLMAPRLPGYVTVIGRTPPDARPFPVPDWQDVDLLDHAQLTRALTSVHTPGKPVTGMILAQRYRGNDDHAWDHEFEVVVTASKVAMEWAAAHCAAGASIVALTSPASERVITEQNVAYHVSKAALAALVRYYAVLLAPKQIRVNAIAPSATAQPRNAQYYAEHPAFGQTVPMGRLGTPEDIGDVAAFLLSNAARFITGQSLTVDGGMSLLHPHSLLKTLRD